MRDQQDAIRARGAELAIVGNGARSFASAFREDLGLDALLLVDPELRAYRAAGLRRGRVEALSPRLAWNAVRAYRAGARQTGVQGDPWQLGGVFVIRPGGELVLAHRSREAGDHPDPETILTALSPNAPALPETRPSGGAPALLGRVAGRLLDPAIPLSFSQAGFALRSLGFAPEDLDVDLSGRRYLVTGGNSGIGYETALALADLGAHVVLLCRSPERGEEAAQRIRERTGNSRVEAVVLDVSDLGAVRAAAKQLGQEAVDGLIHNAGVLPAERIETREGLELTFATHVAGPFLLTHGLRSALERSPDARLVWVSSGGMYTRALQLADPNWEKRSPYDGVVAYAETKRAQVVLASLWAEALRGTSVAVSAMHPGWVDTSSVRTSLPRFWRVTRPILRLPAAGADTVVWLAVSPRARDAGGRFYFDREPRSPYWLPGTRETEDERRALWNLCEAWIEPGQETSS